MFIYSTWVNALSKAARITSLAEQVTNGESFAVRDDNDGVLWMSPVELSQRIETPWRLSEADGTRWWGFAHLPVSAEGIEQLVGIAAPSEAWLASLTSDVHEAMRQAGVDHEPVVYSFGSVLGSIGRKAGLQPRSIRLNDGEIDLVLQSSDEESLRNRLTEVGGEIVGVTLGLGDDQVTLFQDGTTVFEETADLGTLLRTMRVLQATLHAHVTAW